MTLRFFVDECLSPEIVPLIVARGYEATCSRDRGMSGAKDWTLRDFCVAGDWILITGNSIDFRGPTNLPGTEGLYADLAIHAGLVCFSWENGTRSVDDHLLPVKTMLDEVSRLGDLINKCLELAVLADGRIEVSLYDLPAE